MNIIQVVPSIAEQASGPSYSVPALCEALADQYAQVSLHVLGPVRRQISRVAIHEYPSVPFLQRLGYSKAMKVGLQDAASSADIMHNHSLWMMPNVYPGLAVERTRCRLITSPRGTLAAWALSRSALKKHLMWHLCQRRAIRNSACFHATSESEYAEIRAAGLRVPVAIIPNGIDLPDLTFSPACLPFPRRLLFLSRIHPKKGIDILIRAWRLVQDRSSDWELHIAGPDNNGYLRKMRELAHSLGTERICFLGPVYDAQKVNAYRQAQVFILPSHSENFGVAVAEALSYGLPVIVTRGAPWAEIERRQCGWWIENSVESVAGCLRQVLSMPSEQLLQYGARGRTWMASDFAWSRIGQMMYETYQWVLGGGSPPPWMRNVP